jgi:hypothetical protein
MTTNANLCPSTVDLFFARNDTRPWTYTIRNADGTPLDITGWAFHLLVDELQDPPDASTQVGDVVGVVVDGTSGQVEFAFSPSLAAIDAGIYWWDLVAVLPSPTTATLAHGSITWLDEPCHCLPLTDVDLCNMALGFIGHGQSIASLFPADPSQAAQLCSTYYETAVSAVLEMHGWTFATRHVALTALTSEREEWPYAYEVPDRLLRVLQILPAGAQQDVVDLSIAGQDYTIEQMPEAEHGTTEHTHSHGATHRMLYSKVPDARLRYIEECDDARIFPPLFRLAVAYHLASIVGPTLLGGSDAAAATGEKMARMFSAYLAQAQKHDTRNRRVKPTYTPGPVKARRY